jgi:hypothetical protein
MGQVGIANRDYRLPGLILDLESGLLGRFRYLDFVGLVFPFELEDRTLAGLYVPSVDLVSEKARTVEGGLDLGRPVSIYILGKLDVPSQLPVLVL